jgi:hypothetical protein
LCKRHQFRSAFCLSASEIEKEEEKKKKREGRADGGERWTFVCSCVCSVSSPSALVIKLIDFLIVPRSIVKEMNRVIRLGESGGRWKKIDFFFIYIFSIFPFLLLTAVIIIGTEEKVKE